MLFMIQPRLECETRFLMAAAVSAGGLAGGYCLPLDVAVMVCWYICDIRIWIS